MSNPKNPGPRLQRNRSVGAGPTPAGMSEFEFALIIASHGFQSWITRCMEASGGANFGAIDVLVLHAANHRARNRKAADIALVMNIQDTHIIAYSLKKLEGLGLVKQDPATRGYRTTEKGDGLCAAYYRVRKQCLIDSVDFADDAKLGEMVGFLRQLSGHYEQAARAATVLAAEKDDPMAAERH